MLSYKSIPFEIKELAAGADGGWEIAGLASTWWGEPDAYNDVVAPGAFAASIAERATKFLYEHHTPIGKQLEIRETDDGLYGRWSIVDTAAGTDAHKLAKAGVLDSLSIGYVPLEWDIRADGVRVLQKVTLYEVSAVAIPANANAVITDVKAAGRARRRLRRKQYGWSDEPISTFAEGSYEQRAEDLEEAFEAVALASGQRVYVEVVATFADHFVALVTVLGADGYPDPVAAEDPVYWQVPYVLSPDGTITLGPAVQVEPETTFQQPDTSQRSAGSTLHIDDELRRRRLARHGIALPAPTEAAS
jgi:HK97 family phage prohead protease